MALLGVINRKIGEFHYWAMRISKKPYISPVPPTLLLIMGYFLSDSEVLASLACYKNNFSLFRLSAIFTCTIDGAYLVILYCSFVLLFTLRVNAESREKAALRAENKELIKTQPPRSVFPAFEKNVVLTRKITLNIRSRLDSKDGSLQELDFIFAIRAVLA